MLFHKSFHNRDQTNMPTIYLKLVPLPPHQFFFGGGGGGCKLVNFIQAVLTCIHHCRLEAV